MIESAEAAHNSTLAAHIKCLNKKGFFCIPPDSAGIWLYFSMCLRSFLFIITLFNISLSIIHTHTHPLSLSAVPIFGSIVTWILLVVVGIFFTVGSYVFLRPFYYPPLPPCLPKVKCCRTDQILSAWLFFIASIPSGLYVLVYVFYEWRDKHHVAVDYIIMTVFAAGFFLGCLMFVYTTYAEEEEQRTYFTNAMRWSENPVGMTTNLSM